MIPVSKPLIEDKEQAAVAEVLASGMVAQGPRVAQFEEAYAEYCGVKHAIAVSSGTTALHLAVLAHGIGPGDEIITSPFTFFATASAILMAGATPVFCDIDPVTFNLDPNSTAALIGPRTKAIMPVHLFGHPADMGAICSLTNDHGLVLIEDAAQAHGAQFGDRRAGAFGAGCFSFYATKNMTSAEGGMITTNDDSIADKARVLRNHGMRQRYYHEVLGYNYRMTDIHAAIGLVQLGRIDAFNRKRRENAEYLTKHLSDLVRCPQEIGDVVHVYHQYTVRVPGDRDRFASALADQGVGCGVFYPVPLYAQSPILENGGRVKGGLPETEKACKTVLSLPVHPGLSTEDLEAIVDAVCVAAKAVG